MNKVHRPVVNLDARGRIETHGPQTPIRGVWHCTQSSDAVGKKDLEGVVSFWEKQGLGYGAALVIDKAGLSALCADPDQITWAVENHNTGTVSIELIGWADFRSVTWLARKEQLDKLAKWMAWLKQEYKIPLTRGVNVGWSTHAEQSKAFGGTHTDPGKFFPTYYVMKRAQHFYAVGW